MVLISLLLLVGLSLSAEIPLEVFIKDALQNNLELSSQKRSVKASEYEYKSVRSFLFPTIKLEETYTQTDISSYYLFTKLNQERISFQDFNPSKLKDPGSIQNFETKISLEIPIWMGGKLRAFKNMAKNKWEGDKTLYGRKEEEVILKVYEAYANAVLAKKAVEVAKKAVKDAQEHVRLAQKAYKTGVALFADVLRAKVYLSKAKEKLAKARNNYEVAKKALELLTNKRYGNFDVKDFSGCPSVKVEELKSKALRHREDYLALKYYIMSLREGQRSAIGDMLPQVFAFAQYSMYDENTPFGSQGEGYMVGVGVKWAFNTGLGPLFKKKSFKEKELALEKRRKLLAKAIEFEIEKAFTEYKNALKALESAKSRKEEAKEVLRNY